MARIAVLPESIANRIAAGEVVERPFSALKELIENAIDARARTVRVALESGGRDAITVIDDGEGMGPDDVLLALERHATSKIRSDADIERVSTLGFRGEALPAIASVSRFRIGSRDESSETATVVEVHAGRIASVIQETAPRGTRVDVRGLFYNAPARRKFLRSAETERQRSAEVVSRFAIGYPEIRFSLSADGRPVFDHAAVASPFERCAQVFGRELSAKLLAVDARADSLTLVGLCSGLAETRSHSRDQHLYINRRPVKDRLLSHAIAAAYSEALPRGRHPVLILLLEVPAETVDVNVHPTKSEVRFRAPAQIHQFLETSLRRVLRESGAFPAIAPRARADSPGGLVSEPEAETDGALPGQSPVAALGEPGERGAAWRPALAGSYGISGAARWPGGGPRDPRLPGSEGYVYAPFRIGDTGGPAADAAASWGEAGGPFGSLTDSDRGGPDRGKAAQAATPLGQFLDSYILASQEGALLLVDQHAAHERILFEKIFRSDRPRDGRVQRLLVPVTVELAPSERGLAQGLVAALNQAAFEVETFGEAALLVRGVPAGMDIPDPALLTREVLSDLQRGRPPAAPDQHARRVAASVACHAAIKVHFPLATDKMAWLLSELFRCETPTTCPHGRPAILRMTREEIERGFHRR